MPLTGAKDVNWHEAGPKEGPTQWEDALGHLSEAKK
jgi:hypothetical protein